jgi:hypothetical protein
MTRSKLITTLFLLSTVSLSTVTVQAEERIHSGFFFEVEPFYGKATDTLLTNSIFALKTPDAAIIGDFKEEYHQNVRGKGGIDLAVGYDFRCTPDSSYGVYLEYTSLDQRNTRTIINNSLSSKQLPVLTSAEFIDITDEAGAKFSNVKTRFTQDYQTLDLNADKRYFFCQGSNIKIFSGIRYFYLREQLHNNYSFVGNLQGVNVSNLYQVHFKNKLNTVGPQVGGKIFYQFAGNFGITGQLAGSLLYGQSRSEFHNFYSRSPASALGPITSLRSANHLDNVSHLVPALSGKIGLAYQAYFNCTSALAVEVGYRGDEYFNAANDVAYQQLLAGDDINSNSNYQNFNVSGPYLNISLFL